MEKVIAFLKRLHPVSASLEAELRALLYFTTVKKNALLQAEGEVSRYAWYLQKGLVRCFYRHHDSEVTTWFMPEDNVIVLFKSLFRQVKSKYSLQALEDCQLYCIRFGDIQHLIETYPEALRIRTMITDFYVNLNYLKIRAIGENTAKERYRYFEKHLPRLLNRVKLEYVASYLNLSKRSLARARKR
jgi:CRP-like cAMP-binding protein